MKFKATDAYDRYKPIYKKRDKYILKFLNKEIKKVKEKQLFLQLPVVFDFDKRSLIFDKKLLFGFFDFELSDIIFKTLEDNGYHLEFKKLDEFNEYRQSGKFIDCYQAGYVKIMWDKYYEKKDPLYYLVDPVQLKSFCTNYDAIAERYIEEIIEPKIKDASYSKTYITLPAKINNHFPQENSLIFTSDYSQSNGNVKLTNTIINILTENGFSCEFEYDENNKENEGYLNIKWFAQ